MKSQKGITMVSLIIYIIVMIIVIYVMSSIISNFYKNTDAVRGNVEEVVKFNKFNNYFLKEVKTKNNEVDSLNSSYILFSSGNSFSISNNVIYYNNIEICDEVEEMNITFGKNGDEVDKSIISVNICFESFSKTINYKLEEIY